MPLIPIENIGALGIVLDTPPHELPPEAWSNGQNVRFSDGKVEKMKGETDVFGTPGVAPHWLLPWKTLTTESWIYAGAAKVYSVYNSIHTDITRYTTTPGDDDYNGGARPIWTGGNLHGVPILNLSNFTDYPQQWDSVLGRLKNLDNWPVNTYAKVMRPFKNFLVALHISKSAVEYPYIVKWSHPADPGTVPSSWDENDASKLAGEQPISQSGGFLVDCLPLAGQNILYKEDAIWSMQLAGSQNVFAFGEISGTIGALAPRCIQPFYRQHIIVGKNDIVVFDGITPKSIVNKRVRKWFFDSLHESYWDRTVVTINYPQREVWISFVESGSTSAYLTRALIWNWDTNTWTNKALPDISFLAYGVVNEMTVETFDSVAGDGVAFDEAPEAGAPFDASGISPAQLQLLFAKAYSSPALLQGDIGYDSNGVGYYSYLERTGLAIVGHDRQGNPKVDPASIKLIRSVFPKISAPTSVTLQISIGVQETIEGAVRWEGPYDFIVGQDIKVDCSLSGRFIAIKIEDSGSVPWVFSGYTIDLDVISEL